MFYKLILNSTIADLDNDSWILTLPTTIGRNPEHGVCINHESISRTHCQLVLNSQETLMVRDLGSTNGTYVRDQRIQHPTELFPGDNFQVGGVSFRIEYESDTDHGKPKQKPKPFDLTATKPMQKLDKSMIDQQKYEPVTEPKKWWQFWKD